VRAVLGIDAAWTSANPSGFALAVNTGTGWKLRAAADSYAVFHRLAHDRDWLGAKSLPEPAIILQTAGILADRPIDVVAVDMPLSMAPINGRRASDNAVSREYGSRFCSTHSPSVSRPGKISDDLRTGFLAVGYDLATSYISVPSLIEVYPHPALVELAHADQRLPYKIGNVSKYWRKETPARRRELLLAEWDKIVGLLEEHISGVEETLSKPDLKSSAGALKAYEDSLDAVICAWVGICALEGIARPLGDHESAIWIPVPQATTTGGLSWAN